MSTTRTDGRRAALREAHERERGRWSPALDDLLERDPDYLEHVLRFTGHPWRNGVLEPKVKELIYTAFDVSATHKFESGLRQHIRNAIGYGATAAEIMEVIELASGIGVEAFALGLPALATDAAPRRGGA
jgi:alkylhydroperoxidase/carboxymuconolactone decarboxylase family protein YurZ